MRKGAATASGPHAGKPTEFDMITKRQFLLTGASFAALGALGIGLGVRAARSESPAETFEITKTEEEWRAALTEEQYAVLREEATERPWTSELLEEKREGTYACAGCDLPVFSSETKFDSGTGWPSFWAEIEGNVGYKEDRTFFMTRTEEHCSRCGGHLGHVFDDGPQPTGKRHCINGVAMVFHPADAQQTG
jgi:peptide-methionine (R)-S-oxide reductase